MAHGQMSAKQMKDLKCHGTFEGCLHSFWVREGVLSHSFPTRDHTLSTEPQESHFFLAKAISSLVMSEAQGTAEWEKSV